MRTILRYGSSQPAVSSITSNATTSGVLKVGDSITFTLTPSIAESSASVSGYYNGVPLSWTTYNGGATYVATYTVASGNADQTYPLQISNVALANQFGNRSQPTSGYDVAKTIDAHPPVIAEITPVASPATTQTPSYAFSSNDSGTIRYGGDCSSQTTYASAGIITIIFNALPNGTHNNCTITVTDAAGNISNQLLISSFVIGSAAPAAAPAQQKLIFLRPLNIGSEGADVTELQTRLIAEGVYSGPVTGYYGSLTKAAVKQYQAKYGIQQLGIVGPATRASLNK